MSNDNIRKISWDPITRIVGSLGIHTTIDFSNRKVLECRSSSSIFRGYSVFLRGKDPRDAHFITSRICGICGDNHATCAIYAQNMAFKIKPPPMAEWIINLGEAAEYMFDHNLYQDNLVGVDFCEQMVKETNPTAPIFRPTRQRRRSTFSKRRVTNSFTERSCPMAGLRHFVDPQCPRSHGRRGSVDSDAPRR